MAGVRDLTILLLWAAAIGVSSYVTKTSPPRTTTASTLPSVTSQSVTTSPPRTTTAAPVVPSTSSGLKPPHTSPALTSNSSIQAFTSTDVYASPAPSVTQLPLCSYTVTSIDFGLQIDITGSPPGFYTIKINEGGQHETEETFNADNQTSSHDITHLKPCTEYEHKVTFDNGTGRQTPCSSTEHKTRTFNMSQSDVNNTSPCVPGSVCYWSEWDISSSMSTSDHSPVQSCPSDNKTFCIKPGFSDICSDLTTTFTSGHCSSFRLTKNIPVGFLNPNEINSTVLHKLPAEIDTTLPSQCQLTTDYTCQENGQIKELSELEPFTDYSCIGHIKDKNNNTIINTTDIPVRICDLQIINMKTSVTNTSIHLTWTTTSTNCQDVLPTLSKLSYDCSCSPAHNKPEYVANKDPAGGSCEIKGLQPFTDYTCRVQPKYNNKLLGSSAEVRQKTETGVPEAISSLTLSNPENNEIKITCDYKGRLNGESKFKRYHARLYASGDLQKPLKNGTKEKCDFEFKDLSYLTTYTVEVTVENKKHESIPFRERVDTKYNDKAVTGVLIFFFIIIIFIIAAVVVCRIYVLKRRKSRNDVNEDMMLESTAIYMNAPPPGWRRREAR